MHRKGLTGNRIGSNCIENFHPRSQGFEDVFRELRSGSRERILSIAKIVLPFTVETHICEWYLLGCKDSSTRVAYVELCAQSEDYDMVEEKRKSEIS